MDSKQQKLIQSIIEDYKKETKDEKPTQLKIEAWLKKKGKDYLAKKQAQIAQSAKLGAKLDYLKKLTHRCPEGEEPYYFKKGGKAGCGCKKKENGGEVEKALKGTVAKFKERPKINPEDTIHTKKFGVRGLTKGTGYKMLTNDEYSKLTPDENTRVHEKDAAIEAREYEKKNKKIKVSGCGSKMKKKN